MKINDKPAKFQITSTLGPILIVGGPEKDYIRDLEFYYYKSLNVFMPIMSLNHTHNWLPGYPWNFVCTLHPADSPIPDNSHVIGLEVGSQRHHRVDEVLMIDPLHGSVALLGVIAAIKKGYSPVYVLGVYLDKYPYNSGDIHKNWKHWYPYMEDHVVPLDSKGFLKDLFGSKNFTV
ncbi:hypothetical protein LCGC14_0359100 [marine sediment metagenome]|uniref:Uncharacterized protein n=1 Tax=marine sediment metagenome TaxID=412755 RepID=A0A0F9T8F6_9ZZZZ|nr:hypothetical protein [Candidatus Aminicenantes bacterium]